jgi:hypothetical protein
MSCNNTNRSYSGGAPLTGFRTEFDCALQNKFPWSRNCSQNICPQPHPGPHPGPQPSHNCSQNTDISSCRSDNAGCHWVGGGSGIARCLPQ